MLLFAVSAAGCGETSVSEVAVAPSGVRCQTSVGSPPEFPPGGGSVTVAVTAARDCVWSLSSEASWIQVSPSSGQGESEVTLTAVANDLASSRTGAVVVNDRRVMITQAAAPCRFTLDRSQARIGADGGIVTVSVSGPGGVRVERIEFR